jgi:hypothetical protein
MTPTDTLNGQDAELHVRGLSTGYRDRKIIRGSAPTPRARAR